MEPENRTVPPVHSAQAVLLKRCSFRGDVFDANVNSATACRSWYETAAGVRGRHTQHTLTPCCVHAHCGYAARGGKLAANPIQNHARVFPTGSLPARSSPPLRQDFLQCVSSESPSGDPCDTRPNDSNRSSRACTPNQSVVVSVRERG